MNYLYKNNFEEVYQAYVGRIVKIKDSKSKFNNKLMYELGGTSNGFCYKDCDAFKTNSNKVCYIAELAFDDDPLLVDYVNKNKEKLINDGSVSTANSIKDEIKKELEHEEYFYEYEKAGVVRTIGAKDFDDKLINAMVECIFDMVDWQCTQSLINEIDWSEDIKTYYDEKIKESEMRDNYEL